MRKPHPRITFSRKAEDNERKRTVVHLIDIVFTRLLRASFDSNLVVDTWPSILFVVALVDARMFHLAPPWPIQTTILRFRRTTPATVDGLFDQDRAQTSAKRTPAAPHDGIAQGATTAACYREEK